MFTTSSARRTSIAIVACACLASILHAADIETPVSFDDRLVVELVAQEPEIVTPTGIAVDARGRIWCIENNTHFTPKAYKGFGSDRIKIFEDFAPNGRAQKVTTFADGFKNSMGLLLGADGAVFFAMRHEILLLRDTKNAGVADERKTLIKLDTAGNYPHNGLAGLAFGPDGKLYFGLGENLGAAYSIIGSDGTTLKGGGEGGNIYRCEKDGSKLEIIATGFWNPWGLGFDSFGRLFAIDNDPDSRPPCRLLHVVEGGDYGYRFKYGRKGTHPFSAWNGEIPGTLPMVSGTGEAPCAVYACEKGVLPKEYVGNLLVTCWADNVIQRFNLVPKGASFESRPEELIKGGVNFRPVGLVRAPDNSLVVSDWANASYPVHSHGRIWRIRMKTPDKKDPFGDLPVVGTFGYIPDMKDDELLLLQTSTGVLADLQSVVALRYLKSKASSTSILPRLSKLDPFIHSGVVNALARLGDIELLLQHVHDKESRVRLGVLLALRKSGDTKAKTVVKDFLLDSDIEVRRAAVQWVGEEGLKEFGETVREVIKLPMTSDMFKAILATQSLLSGDKPDKGEYVESQMAQIFPSDKHPAHFRALALKNLSVNHPGMKVAILKELLASKEPELRTEAIRALAMHTSPDAQPELRTLANDAALDVELRAASIAGLARSAATSPETKVLLLGFLKEGTPLELQREAIRALRGAATQADVQTALGDVASKIPAMKAEIRAEMAEQISFALKTGGVALNELAPLNNPRPTNEAEWTAALAKF